MDSGAVGGSMGGAIEVGSLDFGSLEPGFRSCGVQGWGGAWRLEAWILEAWSLDSGAVAGSKGGAEPGFRSLEAWAESKTIRFGSTPIAKSTVGRV